MCRSQWPRGLRRRSAAVRLLRSLVWIPPGTWMFVCCECCVLSGRGLCDELITRPEESYRLWCGVVCDLETSGIRRPWSALGRSEKTKNKLNVSTSVPYKGAPLYPFTRVFIQLINWFSIRLINVLLTQTLINQVCMYVGTEGNTTVEHARLPTNLLIPIHVKHIIP
jgi:hypothetical protein